MQRSILLPILASFILLAGCGGNDETTLALRADQVSRAEMQAVTAFLGHDLLEGRAPGTRGGALAEQYIQSLYRFLDFQPEAGGSYLQPF